MQSETTPFHLAIIMDGNGRWGTARGLSRSDGHRAGIAAARRIVEAAPDHGVTTLTLFAFAAANWRRPTAEVATLFGLLARYLRTEIDSLARQGARLSVIGRRDRLPRGLAGAIARAEARTAANTRLTLRIAIDYSARAAILDAATRGAGAAGGESRFADALGADGAAEVDLLIRSGGEQRLSDFLLWECAHAELYFSPILWPDFTPADLGAALCEYHRRQRRFGGLGPAASAPLAPAFRAANGTELVMSP